MGFSEVLNIRVTCPCPPIRNNVVTPRHFFFYSIVFFYGTSLLSSIAITILVALKLKEYCTKKVPG